MGVSPHQRYQRFFLMCTVAISENIIYEQSLSGDELQTPLRIHTHRAFCRICIFANTSEFSKISADDQNPSAHTYPIFFLMQRSISVFAINPPQKSNVFLPPGGRNTRPIVLSVFFFLDVITSNSRPYSICRCFTAGVPGTPVLYHIWSR